MTPRVLSDIGIEEGAFVIHSYPRHTWSRDSLILRHEWSTCVYVCVCVYTGVMIVSPMSGRWNDRQ